MKYNGNDTFNAELSSLAKRHVQTAAPRRAAQQAPLIGLCGRAGVGKTAAAQALCQIFPGTFIRPMAFPLKQLARDYFGWGGEKDQRGRELLQHLGTDTGRAWDPDIWVKKWTSGVFDIWTMIPETGIIVDDVRFQNEVSAIQQLGGICVTLEHPTRGYFLQHASETQALYTNVVLPMMEDSAEDVAKRIAAVWLGEDAK